MATTTEITLEQLASVDANMLFKALEMRLASSGVIKKRGGKKAAKASSASSDDDAASETSRSVGEGTKKWNELTTTVSALVKEALAGEKGGPGFHLKVLSYLKNEKSMAADAVPSLEQVSEAVAFLKSNPEWTSPNAKTKAAKASSSSGGGAAASASSSSGPKIVVKKADAPAAAPSEPKKKGRPAKSEEEKAAEKAAKEAEKAAKKAAEKAEKEAKKAAEKKAAKKPAAAAAKKAEPVEEEEESEFSEIELEGVSYFWDTDSGAVYENIDGHPGEKIGTWNGSDDEITKTE